MRRLILIFSMLFGLLANSGYAAHVILKDIKGQAIPFDSLQGKWVIINYWASWCQPCLDEIGELNHFFKNNKDNVALFAVNYDSVSLANQIALSRKYKINYPSIIDPARDLRLGDIRGVPVTFVFNPRGKLSGTLYGRQTLKSLNKLVYGGSRKS